MRMRGTYAGALCASLAALGMGASAAQANRPLFDSEAVRAKETPAEQIEGACGVAAGPGGEIYVSDYYHRAVDIFAGSTYLSQILTAQAPEGPCGLAFSSAGALYANYYHQGVVRLEPSFATFDEGNVTGVAVDAPGNVYANHRTYVASYKPSGEALAQIGLGSLGDSYGLAVSAFAATLGDVYVADAADDTVKVYEPAVDPDTPSEVIAGPPGGFNSLVDGALAIDPTNGHVLVVDNLQPGFEHPQAAIDEFDPTGVFLGQLGTKIIDAEPPGIAVNDGGALYVTSGNSEEANVLAFGQYSASGPEALAGPEAEQASAAPQALAAVQAAAAAPAPQGTQLAKKPHKKKHRHHRGRKGSK